MWEIMITLGMTSLEDTEVFVFRAWFAFVNKWVLQKVKAWPPLGLLASHCLPWSGTAKGTPIRAGPMLSGHSYSQTVIYRNVWFSLGSLYRVFRYNNGKWNDTGLLWPKARERWSWRLVLQEAEWGGGAFRAWGRCQEGIWLPFQIL